MASNIDTFPLRIVTPPIATSSGGAVTDEEGGGGESASWVTSEMRVRAQDIDLMLL